LATSRLLIDEVLAVGDEAFRSRCIDRVKEFRQSGGSLLFASHEPELVEQLADRQLELRNGLLQIDSDTAAARAPDDISPPGRPVTAAAQSA
jgi:ABC-type polysaccharide/polyol phosphate transport system ATPase subunit